MKAPRKFIKIPAVWLILLFLTDLFFIFLFWLTSAENFCLLLGLILLFTAISLFAGYLFERRRQVKLAAALEEFLRQGSDTSKYKLLKLLDNSLHPGIEKLAEHLDELSALSKSAQEEGESYRSFIEAWVHEIKTPLSLTALLLDNRKKEMSDHLASNIQYVYTDISNKVETILYFARLQGSRADYVFTNLWPGESVFACLEKLSPLIKEREIELKTNLQDVEVLADKKLLDFILMQILTNAIKYSPEEGARIEIRLSEEGENKKVRLSVKDNGCGLAAHDLPFIFDKGFTSGGTKNQNATGMGLYLVRQYAKILSIEIELNEKLATDKEGFEISLIFPLISKS